MFQLVSIVKFLTVNANTSEIARKHYRNENRIYRQAGYLLELLASLLLMNTELTDRYGRLDK